MYRFMATLDYADANFDNNSLTSNGVRSNMELNNYVNRYETILNDYNQIIENRKNLIFPVEPSMLKSAADEEKQEAEDLLKVHDIAGKFKNLMEQRKAVTEMLTNKQVEKEELGKAASDLRQAIKDWHIKVCRKAKFNFEDLQDTIDATTAGTFEATQAYDTEIERLQSDLAKLDTRLNILRNAICVGLDEVKAKSEEKTNLCAICFENEVSLVAVPCGHTVCKGCATNLNLLGPIPMAQSWRNQTKKCPTCRTDIKEVIKFFFSI